MTKHQEMAAATKESLERAFLALYRERPVEDIAVKEVVALANCNRSTFYEYFGSVYDLLETLEGEAVERVAASISSAPVTADNLEQLPRVFLMLLHESGELFAVLLRGSHSYGFIDGLKTRIRPVLLKKIQLAESHSPVADYALEIYLSGMIDTVASLLRSDVAVEDEALAALARATYLILNEGVIAATAE